MVGEVGMKYIPFHTLKQHLEDHFDPEDLVDILSLSTTDIIDAFKDRIEERRFFKRVIDALNDTEFFED